ncbi:MerR family transcriptional regulator [Rhodovulum adriaticum]|uniref:DNA-binding transcriptional MerR regulator n=1 Tax=Rhodovulum adriaticum TaxID=35804 RepID=A0A4R2NTW6_RHOAD|nr:MerR family transcriptional regulator [Rhodovulum adriaticum]TCP25410.1 DNA-binding transcriptional MerR regulator [Rhodovulum adriaticum]
MEKSPDAFRTISEVSDWLDTPPHVLRFWESRFTQVKPVKRAGGRRYYRPADMQLLGGIKRLLHEEGMTIRGVQKILREEGVRLVADLSPPLPGEQRPEGSEDIPMPPLPATRRAKSRKAPAKPVAEPAEPDAEEAPMLENAEPEKAEDNVVSFTAPPIAATPGAPELPGLFDAAAKAESSDQGETDTPPAAPKDAAPATSQDGAEPPTTEGTDTTGEDRATRPILESAQAAPPAEAATAPVPNEDPSKDAAAPPPTDAPAEIPQDQAAPETAETTTAPQDDAPAADTGDAATGAAAQRRPLGADLPVDDPADDDPAYAPDAPPLRVRLHEPRLRQAIQADPARVSAALERLNALAARMDENRGN